MTLPDSFLTAPIAHRALHDQANGRPENSCIAIRAAIAAGYGIEIDLQLSRDSQAMVFHDYDLKRLTGVKGPVQQHDASELSNIKLLGGDEGIPTLRDILDIVDGAVPLLIELKDQDGAMGANVGRLEQATADALQGYHGDVALMSFNPNSVIKLRGMTDGIPLGIVTCSYSAEDWPTLNAGTRNRLRKIPDYDVSGACFISHNRHDLNNPRVADLKSRGARVLTWTIRSAEQEQEARKLAENITFEGYKPA